MPTAMLMEVAANTPIAHAASGTFYHPVQGELLNSTNENTSTNGAASYSASSSLTFSLLTGKVTANANNGSTFQRFRKNGADGSQTITFATTVTGTITDVTHTDSVVNSDRINYVTYVNGGSGSVTIASISGLCDSGSAAFLFGGNSPMSANGAFQRGIVTQHTGVGITTEANAQCTAEFSFTLTNFEFVVGSVATGTKVARVRKNGANGNLTCSGGNNASGQFEDVTHSDSFAAGDEFNFSQSGATQSTRYSWFGALCTGASTKTQSVSAGTISSDVYIPFIGGGSGNSNATESNCTSLAIAAFILRNFSVNVVTNANTTGDATCKVRANAATVITITLSNSQTGIVENTTNTYTTAATDTMAMLYDEGSASAAFLTFAGFYIELEPTTAGSPVNATMVLATADAASLDLLAGLGTAQAKATADAAALAATASIVATPGLATASAIALALQANYSETMATALANAVSLELVAAIVATQPTSTASAAALALLAGVGTAQGKATAQAIALDATASIVAALGLSTATAQALALTPASAVTMDLALATAIALVLDYTAILPTVEMALATADAIALAATAAIVATPATATASAAALALLAQLVATGFSTATASASALAIASPGIGVALDVSTASAQALAATAALVGAMGLSTASGIALPSTAALVLLQGKSTADAVALAFLSGVGTLMAPATADAASLAITAAIVAALGTALANVEALELAASQDQSVNLMNKATATAVALDALFALNVAGNVCTASAQALSLTAAIVAAMQKSTADALALALATDIKTAQAMSKATADAVALAATASLIAALQTGTASANALSGTAALVALLGLGTASGVALPLALGLGLNQGTALASGAALDLTMAIVATMGVSLAVAEALVIFVETFQGQLIRASFTASGLMTVDAGMIIVYKPGQGEEWDDVCLSLTDLVLGRVPRKLKYLPHVRVI